MNKKYNLKLDLQFRCNNSTMKFNQFDNNTSDFFMRITNGGKLVDIEKAIVVLAVIKPSGKVASQFVEVENGLVYADLKPSMKDEIGTYTAKAMLILENERVVTDSISYEVEEDKIFSLLNDTVEATEEFTLLTDMLSRLSTIEISEEQRVINEAERILSEENRKIEEAKRVEAELIRQHEEADRAKYDATRESNENIRKQNESIRLANETNRIDEEAKRVEEENKRKLAEEERNANYNFMTEDEERRRSEANAHKEAEVLRVQAETNRVNEEAKRRTTEQARVSAENTRVNNENTRKANETTRQTNETHRVEAETQRQNRYNSFISDAESNANNFENYTNTAKVKEEERKANELDRKSQEAKRVSNENERVSNENIRKANEVVREENETSRQNVFENKVSEVDEKIVELNTTKDNFVSSINTKVDNKISEIDNAKTDMSNTVSNKIDEVENRFNALTSKQQQDSEVIDARDGETSLKARLDRDIEKAKQGYVNVEGSHISTDSSVGYAKDVEILGNTIQDASNLADIRSVGDKVEGQELYEIPVVSCGKNLFDDKDMLVNKSINDNGNEINANNTNTSKYIRIKSNTNYATSTLVWGRLSFYDENKKFLFNKKGSVSNNIYVNSQTAKYVRVTFDVSSTNIQLEEGTVATPYEPYQEDKLTILSPVQLEKVGDVADRIVYKDGVWGVEKNVETLVLNGLESSWTTQSSISPAWRRFVIENIEYMDDEYDYTNPNKTLCDSFVYDVDDTKQDSTYLKLYNKVGFYKNNIDNLNDFKSWVANNNILLKYITTQPQFIPLPHSQQVKLRTFASKTNISFLTEIEGTIKAQVPKSLGVTVNTHTEQINNLNKELDRVKKLEESTVSTVTTESDFTTVEATSNGYFEDVKLEGRTLVNLFDYSTPFNTHWKDITISQGFKPNTKYTFIIQSSGDASSLMLGVLNTSGNWSCLKEPYDVGSSIFMLTTDSNPTNTIRMGTLSPSGVVVTYNKIIILEGDHTQNPPSYFEGLKSVGQSTSEDGADEIVVSSVNDEKRIIQEKTFATKIELVFDRIYTNCTIYNPLDKPIRITNWDNEGHWVKDITIPAKSSLEVKFGNGITNINSIIASFDDGFTAKDFSLLEKVVIVTHKSDKKRLLYYNEETQSWEKPILRQWDSIEKHADGKYYYHQRSREVMLNGDTSWRKSSVLFDDKARFIYDTKDDLQANVDNLDKKPISDKYIVSVIANVGDLNTTTPLNYHIAGRQFYLDVVDMTLEDFNNIYIRNNPFTLVYQLAQEKVYECTNIDLITYANETNYIVESGAISPKSTLKVHSNISNVVSLLQKKVSLLESDLTKYMITQNRLMLASRYNADTVSFKVDVATLRNSFEYDNDLYELILNNILVGKDNYNREYIENLIIFYWMDFVISDEMYLTLFEIIEEQHNPKIEEETPLI